MRFLKRANIRELKQYCDTYKDFELSLSSDDIQPDNIEAIKEWIAGHGIRISALHCPGHRNSEDDLTICEIMTIDSAKKIFEKTCDFAKKLSEISYKDKSGSRSIIVIVHEGCDEHCKLQETDRTECRKQKLYSQFLDFIQNKFSSGSYSALQIGIKDISAHEADDKSCRCSSCQVLLPAAEQQNSLNIGRVIDFCHIISEKYRLLNGEPFENYLTSYMEQFEKNSILLFQLSNFNPQTGVHNEMFHDTEKDNKIFDAIFKYCLEHHRSLPVTLEGCGSDSKEAAHRFDSIMIRWSRLHTLPKFKDQIIKKDEDLFYFFDNLYQAFISDTETEANLGELFEAADKIRNYILANYKSNQKYPLGFSPKEQLLDLHRFQIQAYVYYMQYMHAAENLLHYYNDMLENFDFSVVLKNYMFHDTLEELKFDGLVGYFNIPWLMKKEITLYHFYDGYEGDQESHGTFKKEIACCMKHISEPQPDNSSEVMSFSKAFGRCALKYYEPPHPGLEYNIRIVKTPINCFYDGKNWIPLQAAPRTDPFMDKEQNFIIDFSEYYFGRGDASPEGSLLELYRQETGEKGPKRENIASIYDQEIHIKNANGIQWKNYRLGLNDMLILLIFYKYLCSSKNYSVHQLQIPTESKRCQDILEILSQINFEWEREFYPDTKHESYSECRYTYRKKALQQVKFHVIYDHLPYDIYDYDKACDWLDKNSIKEQKQAND